MHGVTITSTTHLFLCLKSIYIIVIYWNPPPYTEVFSWQLTSLQSNVRLIEHNPVNCTKP